MSIKKYTNEFRLFIVKMILDEKISKHRIEREYNISRKAQRNWVKKFLFNGEKGLRDQRHDKKSYIELINENTTLKREIENLNIEIQRLTINKF